MTAKVVALFSDPSPETAVCSVHMVMYLVHRSRKRAGKERQRPVVVAPLIMIDPATLNSAIAEIEVTSHVLYRLGGLLSLSAAGWRSVFAGP